jgi:F-type H+-transporting ATPase subunit alpha
VISITDGQIYLEPDLFFSGIRPAMNAGESVSRVGGNAQIPAMKKIAGPLRLNLAQYRELEAFAEFGSELDATSLASLERGRRVVETLKQGQYVPMPVSEQVVLIYGVTAGYMDNIAVSDIQEFEDDLLEYFRNRHRSLLDEIADTGSMEEEAVGAAIESFAESWAPEGQ